MQNKTPKQIPADATVVDAIWRWLNEWPDKPPGIDEINLDAMGKHPPAMLLQPLPAAVVDRQYVNSSFVGRWPFSIVVKTNAGDDVDRVDAFAAINGIHGWMRSRPLPALPGGNAPLKITITTLPMKSAEDASGAEYYEAAFELTYYHKEG